MSALEFDRVFFSYAGAAAPVLLDASLEDSVERADVMRARGWESGRPRTSYRLERLRRRDAAALVGIAGLLVACAACAWQLCATWRFYPTMGELGPWWAYAPWVVLVTLPSLEQVSQRGTGSNWDTAGVSQFEPVPLWDTRPTRKGGIR